MIDQEAIDYLCAAYLVQVVLHNNHDFVSASQDQDLVIAYSNSFGISLSSKEIEAVLNRLCELEIIEKVGSKYIDGFFYGNGLHIKNKFESFSSQQIGSVWYHAKNMGTPWLRAIFASELFRNGLERPDSEVTSTLVPAADRLVTVNHNSPEFREVVKAADSADEFIRSSNSIDENKRSWIREHIHVGKILLEKNKILTGAVAALLLKPLLSAYESIAEDPAREAILAAINLIRSFFGI